MGESGCIPSDPVVTVGRIPYPPPPVPFPVLLSTSPTRSLLITHVPTATSETVLRRDFEVFGNVRFIQMEFLCFGMVTVYFYDIRHAETAFTFIRNHPVHCASFYTSISPPHFFLMPPGFVTGGQPFLVHFVDPPFQELNQGNIVVFDLPTNVSAYYLRRLFQPFGAIKEVRENPWIKSPRFIEFFDTRAAALALENMNGEKINGKQVVIEFNTKQRSNGTRFYGSLLVNLKNKQPQPQFYAHTPCQSSSSVLSNDLIEEILSYIPVRFLLRMRCVCKSWKSLISGPTFSKLHLNRSAERNPPQITLADLVLTFSKDTPFLVHHHLLSDEDDDIYITYGEFRNNPLTLENVTKWPLLVPCCSVGSYNGFLCKVHCVFSHGLIYIHLWNPATMTLSTNLTSFAYGDWQSEYYHSWKFAFGGHANINSTHHTYKLVAFHQDTNQVKVFDFSSKFWRDIGSFPLVPFHSSKFQISRFHFINDGVSVKHSLNWLAIRYEEAPFFYKDHSPLLKSITADQFVIISLNLFKETYREFFPPMSFVEVKSIEPTLSSLNDSLCFSHDVNGTHFGIWKMVDYGGFQAWTQIFHISYDTLPIDNGPLDFSRLALFPWWLSRNGNKLLLTWNQDSEAIFYNLRNNRADLKCKINNVLQWVYFLEYVESSAFTC